MNTGSGETFILGSLVSASALGLGSLGWGDEHCSLKLKISFFAKTNSGEADGRGDTKKQLAAGHPDTVASASKPANFDNFTGQSSKVAAMWNQTIQTSNLALGND